MKILSLLVLLVSSLLHTVSAVGTDEVEIGSLRFEFLSRSSSPARDFLSDLLRRTSVFLDKHFQTYFENTIGEEYFSHVGLSAVDFTIDETSSPTTVRSQISSSVDFDLSVFFKAEPLPSKSFITHLLQDAFQSDSRMDFVTELQLSDTSVLRDITYVVVGINDKIIATEDLTLLPETSEDFGMAQATGQHNTKKWDTKKLVIIAGSSAAGAAIVVVGFLLWCLGCCCCCQMKSRTDKDGKPTTIRSIKTSSSRTTAELEVEMELEEERNRCEHLSPDRSICSQESSKFTYNPGSLGPQSFDGTSTIDSRTLPSQFSNLQVDIESNIDVDAWCTTNRPNTISPVTPEPFGAADISVIEPTRKEDLSLIEEGDENHSDEKKRKAAGAAAQGSLTTGNLNALAEKNASSGIYTFSTNNDKSKNDNNRKSSSSSRYFSPHAEEDGGDDTISVGSDGSDIIQDLKKLSRQINRHKNTYSP